MIDGLSHQSKGIKPVCVASLFELCPQLEDLRILRGVCMTRMSTLDIGAGCGEVVVVVFGIQLHDRSSLGLGHCSQVQEE